MINQTEQTLYRLESLNAEQRRISYQMSTKKRLENGSDDAVLYSREIYVEDKLKVFDGLKTQISRTTVHNNVSDTAVGDIKELLEKVKSELLKANSSTTTPEGRKSIAVSIAGMKQNILDLANTRIDGEYVFAGSDSSVRPFTVDSATGKVSYAGDNHLRKIAVDEGSYRDKGVNGFDMMMYSTDTATKGDPNLTFKEDQRIVDQDGFEWKLNAGKTALVRYDLNNNPTTDTLAATADSSVPPNYTVNVGTADGTRFEAKTNIFDALDNVVNALNKVDTAGNPVSDAVANAALTDSLEQINKAYDAVNVAHAELGGRNKVFEISLEKVSAKHTQYNILLQEVASVDLSQVAVEAKALELTFTALYSTINKTNELSLVNFLR